jgi:hypothetical protein
MDAAACVPDVGFMVSHSNAISQFDYTNSLLPFVKSVSTALQPDVNGAHIGVVGFGKS